MKNSKHRVESHSECKYELIIIQKFPKVISTLEIRNIIFADFALIKYGLYICQEYLTLYTLNLVTFIKNVGHQLR